MTYLKRRHCEEAERPARQSIPNERSYTLQGTSGLLCCARNDVLILIMAFLSFFAPAQAATPPLPQNKAEVIGNLDEQLAEEKAHQEALAEKMELLKGNLSKTRQELIRIGRSTRKNEAELQELEDRIEALENQQGGIQETLKEDRAAIARLVLALQRIRRLPPEAIIARPGAPLETAQSAMLLQEIIPTLNNHAKALKTNLEELERIAAELRHDRKAAIVTAAKLRHEHVMISSLIAERERIYKDTNEDFLEQDRAVKRISAQATSLQELVIKLEEERKRARARKSVHKAVHSTIPEAAARSPAPIPRTGEAQLPVSGIITIAYNEPDDFGAESKGITIVGRAGALVVAPMGGVVRFAGPFKRHGNMVILEHKKGYHSLIAGLEKIDAAVGQTLEAGEPLGLMKNPRDQLRPKLYYELRYKGKAVNPGQKFAELK